MNEQTKNLDKNTAFYNLIGKVDSLKVDIKKLNLSEDENFKLIEDTGKKIFGDDFILDKNNLDKFLNKIEEYIKNLKDNQKIEKLSDILDSLNGDLSEILNAGIDTEEALNKIKETLTGEYSVFTGDLQNISSKISGYENSFGDLGINTENYFSSLKKSRNDIGSQISPSFFSESYSETLYKKLNGEKEEIEAKISDDGEVKKVLALKEKYLQENKDSISDEVVSIGESLKEKVNFIDGKVKEVKVENSGYTTLVVGASAKKAANKKDYTELQKEIKNFNDFDKESFSSDEELEKKFQEKIEKNIELNNLILKKLEEKADNIKVKYLKLRLDGIHGNTVNSIFEELNKYEDLVKKGNKIKRLKTKSPKFVSEFLSGIGEKNKSEYISECKKYYNLSENIGKENGYFSENLEDLDSKIISQEEKFSSNQNAKDEKFSILKEKISTAETIISNEEEFLKTEKEKISKKIENLSFDKGLLSKINRLNNTRKITSGNNLNYFNEIKVILENEIFLKENLGKNLNNRKNLENISDVFKILEPLISYIKGENINQVIENFDKNLKSDEKYERLLRVFVNSIEGKKEDIGLSERTEELEGENIEEAHELEEDIKEINDQIKEEIEDSLNSDTNQELIPGNNGEESENENPSGKIGNSFSGLGGKIKNFFGGVKKLFTSKNKNSVSKSSKGGSGEQKGTGKIDFSKINI